MVFTKLILEMKLRSGKEYSLEERNEETEIIGEQESIVDSFVDSEGENSKKKLF